MQKEALANGLSLPISDICKTAASRPAPRFYVELRSALKQYDMYKRGKSSIHYPMKRSMYAEIFARYEELCRPLNADLEKRYRRVIMSKVLEQEAPCFYFDDKTIVSIYYKYDSEKRMYNNI